MRAERGASAVIIAAATLVLFGMAAIAIDLGAGFNERNQDQTAGDNSAMAGALEVTFSGLPSDVATETLAVAQANLDTVFGGGGPNDAAWVELWRSCSDTTKPASFQPIAEPTAWAGVITATPSTGTLDCISRAPSFLRVRIPNQTVDTSFGRILGASSINTNAVSVARIAPAPNSSPLVPYGIAGGFANGEACFGTAPSGSAFPPCNGSSSGTFGTLLSEFFGDFYGTVDCGNPGATEIATATAIGVDHFIELWPNGVGLPGAPHPGDVAVLALAGTNRDACDNVGGSAQGVDGANVNTVRVDTGYPSAAMESGLVSNNTFFGSPSRLQQGTNAKRTVVARRQGINETLWDLDNRGPWEYLNNISTLSECRQTSYTGLATVDPDPLVVTKASLFEQCLQNYTGSDDLFTVDLVDSPRLVVAPQYWFDLPSTGLSWEPVDQYRFSFVAGTFYNCNAGGCAVVHYPDGDFTTDLCDPSGPSNCTLLSLDQFSAWVLPEEMIPDEILNTFPGGSSPFAPELFE